ncbi:MAG: MogA/MoaB family molybdenum cofactor biosynthesis protein [Caldisphaera sp.]|jgi:molybdenum cofactor biosynthesis protein B|nr:molybdenum cofactor biosynthesis protein B [Caldisphaera sp.]PMP90401.1 MAG: molybdenum cofactor biosynthesis protein MoaB [Caldisphaera sp.]
MARFALVVTSDSVYYGNKKDEITPIVEDMIKNSNHELNFKTIVKNDKDEILNAVNNAIKFADIVLITGGTGISPNDISIDTVKPLARDTLPGFGEIHRAKSLNEVGYRAILSRATAFIIGRSIVAVSPGNPSAVKLSLEILIPIADHASEQLKGMKHK